MPVNNYDNYPMAWRPDKGRLGQPVYLSLARQLEDDITAGKLRENARMPPQRELADFLDLNLSTITKVYKLCEKKGLLYAVVGKGTFVSPHVNVPTSIMDEGRHACIEMGMVQPYNEDNKLVRAVAAKILAAPFAERYFDYSHPLGSPAQRETARQWLAGFNLPARAENILITAGTQNALAIVLASLFRSGDKIAVNTHTYPNFIGLANMLGLQLVPVQEDAQGMIPEELRKACRASGIKGVYLMPSCANPTTLAIGAARRRELADTIRRARLTLLEDESYAFLAEQAGAPLTAGLPEQAVYISGLSKPISAGLRVAYIVSPPGMRKTLEKGLYNLSLKTPSLNIEIASEIIRSGLYREILGNKREMSAQRNRICAEALQGLSAAFKVHPTSYFQWLPLPGECSGRAFEALAAEKGVRVYGSERFSVGNIDNGHFARLVTSSPASTGELRNGLEIIKRCYLDFTRDEPAYII